MIREDHFQSRAIQERLDELHRLWDLLLIKLSEKGLRLQQALVSLNKKKQKLNLINRNYFSFQLYEITGNLKYFRTFKSKQLVETEIYTD